MNNQYLNYDDFMKRNFPSTENSNDRETKSVQDLIEQVSSEFGKRIQEIVEK